jgi:phytoene/squalene synthetase
MPSHHAASWSQFIKPLSSQEPDLWLGAAVLHPDLRGHWLGLLAARKQWQLVPGQVSEPMIGHIRLAWWRELLQDLRAGNQGKPHPLKESLQFWMQDARSAELLEQLLEVVSVQLDENPSIAAGEATQLEHAHAFDALLRRMDVEPAQGNETALLLAQGWAWLSMLREMPLRLRDGSLPLPQEWLLAYGLPLEPEAYTAEETITLLRTALAKFLREDWLPNWKQNMQALTLAHKPVQQFISTHHKIAAHYLTRAANAPEKLSSTALLAPSRILLPLKLLVA